MKDYGELAGFIVENVGGSDNVRSVSHCVTRLRFYLNDESLANTELLQENDGVLQIVQSGGQYQVVIGDHVTHVYDETNKILGVKVKTDVESDKPKKSPVEVGFALLGVVIGPPLNLIYASGIILGLNILAVYFGLYTDASTIYTVVDIISKTLLFFFPIVVAAGFADALEGDQVLAMILGGVLCYPTISSIPIELFGHTFVTSYTGSFLPVMIIVPIGLALNKKLKALLP